MTFYGVSRVFSGDLVGLNLIGVSSSSVLFPTRFPTTRLLILVTPHRPIGRPSRYAKFDEFEASLPVLMTKRPLYCDGVGLFRGSKSYTVWVKVRLARGGIFKGRSVAPGGSVEIKLGRRASFNWQQIITERDRLQGLADRGEPLEKPEMPNFAALAADWLSRRGPTLRGLDVARSHISGALGQPFGMKALDDIQVHDVNRWISEQSSRLKPGTVQRQLATFNAIMNDAVRCGLLERNPSEKAQRIRGIEPRQRFVTEVEWKRILAAAAEIEAEQEQNSERTPQQVRGWLCHYIRWAYNSGMRRGEILRLTFDNIRPIEKGHTVVEVTGTKTGKPRFVTCTNEMLAILHELSKLDRAPGDQRLFPVSMTTLKRSLTRLWRRTGLSDIRLHDLRRTHATILLKKNIDPRTVAGRLGHSGTAMLARHYAVDLGDVEAARAFGSD